MKFLVAQSLSHHIDGILPLMMKGGRLKPAHSAALGQASAILKVLKGPRFISFEMIVAPAASYVNMKTKFPIYS